MQKNRLGHHLLSLARQYSRVAPPPSAYADPVIRVSKNVAYLGSPKQGPKPRQLLSLPPFPGHHLPGKNSATGHVTAISWLKYYFDEISDSAIQSHFNKGLVSMPNHLIFFYKYQDTDRFARCFRPISPLCCWPFSAFIIYMYVLLVVGWDWILKS